MKKVLFCLLIIAAIIYFVIQTKKLDKESKQIQIELDGNY